jgi:hypothetical protein
LPLNAEGAPTVTSWNEVNSVAVTKLVPLIAVVPENEMLPVMGIGTACMLKVMPVIARNVHMVLGDMGGDFIFYFPVC